MPGPSKKGKNTTPKKPLLTPNQKPFRTVRRVGEDGGEYYEEQYYEPEEPEYREQRPPAKSGGGGPSTKQIAGGLLLLVVFGGIAGVFFLFQADAAAANPCGDNPCPPAPPLAPLRADGQPCCEGEGTLNQCHDWYCGPYRGSGVGGNGKCGYWGPNDPDKYGDIAFKERCCPPTEAGMTGLGNGCHDLPEGADCTFNDQCHQPTDEELARPNFTISRLHCDEDERVCRPLKGEGEFCCTEGGTQACHDWYCASGKCAEMGGKDYEIDVSNLGPNRVISGLNGNPYDPRYKERCCNPAGDASTSGLGNFCHNISVGGNCQFNDQCSPGTHCDEDTRICTPLLEGGARCCTETGTRACHDWYCLSGKCGDWGPNDETIPPNQFIPLIEDLPDADPRYNERCCPHGVEGATTGFGNNCHKLPLGGTCNNNDQCNASSSMLGMIGVSGGLLGGGEGEATYCDEDDRTCRPLRRAGETCCTTSGTQACHDWYCVSGKCGDWGPNDHTIPSNTLFPYPGPTDDPDPRANERCCPETETGTTGLGNNCHDIPIGGQCNNNDQCSQTPPAGVTLPEGQGYAYCDEDERVCKELLQAGEACCTIDGTQACHDWYCLSGKCGDWGPNDHSIDPSTFFPDVTTKTTQAGEYNERCCTQEGTTGAGNNCHEIPEGGTCNDNDQCAGDGAGTHFCDIDTKTCRRRREAGEYCCSAAGTRGCHDWYCTSGKCGDWGPRDETTPPVEFLPFVSTETTPDARYNERCCPAGGTGLIGNNCGNIPLGGTCEKHNQCSQSPTNAFCDMDTKVCTARKETGAYCCAQSDSNVCAHDYCESGKCGHWWNQDYQRNTEDFVPAVPNALPIPDVRYNRRCCPNTDTGRGQALDWCGDIPIGGSCESTPQCAQPPGGLPLQDRVFCDKDDKICKKVLPAGSPCCTVVSGYTECVDECASLPPSNPWVAR